MTAPFDTLAPVSRRLSLFVFLVALLGSCSLGGTALGARLYVPEYGSGPPERIGAFDLAPNGSLTPLAGSPFPAVTAGILGLRNVAFTPDGTRAATGFFLSGGGVQGYSVPPSGIFALAAGDFPTASVTAVAITPDGRYAYASTREFGGTPAEGIRRYAVGDAGSLISLGPPTPLGSSSYDVVVSPDGRFLFAPEGGKIARFAIGADGGLTSLGATPAPGAFELATSMDERFLYVYVENGGAPGLAVYEIGSEGGLSQRGTTAELGAGSSGSGFTVAPDGRHAYLIDHNSGGRIVTVAIAEDGSPTLLPGELSVYEGQSLIVAPDGRHLVYHHEELGGGFVLDVAAIGADGSLTKLPLTTLFGENGASRMSFQPQPTPVARFTAQAAAPGDQTRFDAAASTGAARYDWDFGDGTTLVDGGPSPTHAYAQPGVYTVTLSVIDRNGCGARHYYEGHSTVCPGGSTTIAAGSVDTLPALGRLKAVPKKFVPKPKGKAKGKFGTSFRYTVNEVAAVRFRIERKVPRPIKCTRPKKCTHFLFKSVGSRSQKAKAGTNKLKWNGQVKGKPLPAGSYRATVVATDKAGGRSAAKTVGFRILSLPPKP